MSTLARLEDSGLLTRQRVKSHRRSVAANLTPAGQTRLNHAVVRCVAGMATVAGAFNECQLRGLLAACNEINAATSLLLTSAPDPAVVEQISDPLSS